MGGADSNWANNILVNKTTPTDPAVVQAQEQAIAKIKEEKKQLEKSQMELQKRSELLCGKEAEIKCCTTKEVDAILSCMRPALIILPVEEASKLKRIPEDDWSPPQQRGAQGNVPKKTKTSEKKRSSAESQELCQFLAFRQKVIGAERHINNSPTKKSTDWEKKEVKA